MRKKILLLFLGILFAFLVGEILTRIFLPPLQKVVFQPTNFHSRLQQENSHRSDFSLPSHPSEGGLYVETETGRRLRANTRVTILNHSVSHRTVEISTNSIGYRNPEIGVKAGTRILFLGDSITFADYLPEQETFVRLAETIARQHGKNWQTINAGVGSVSLKTELAILHETGLALKPDVVVVCFFLDDFRDAPGVRITPLPLFLDRSTFASYLYLFTARTLFKSKEETGPDFSAIKIDFLARHHVSSGYWRTNPNAFYAMMLVNLEYVGATWSPITWKFMLPLFEEAKSLAQQNNFKLCIVAFPIRQQVETVFDTGDPQKFFKQMTERINVPALDLLPVFRKAWQSSNEPIFYDVCHHTPRGSKIVAEEIYKFLSS